MFFNVTVRMVLSKIVSADDSNMDVVYNDCGQTYVWDYALVTMNRDLNPNFLRCLINIVASLLKRSRAYTRLWL